MAGWELSMTGSQIQVMHPDTVADGTLESGDEIAIMYTSNGYGEDIGGTWANNDTTVKSVEITGAELSG